MLGVSYFSGSASGAGPTELSASPSSPVAAAKRLADISAYVGSILAVDMTMLLAKCKAKVVKEV